MHGTNVSEAASVVVSHPLGVAIAILFIIILGVVLFWMLHLPQPMPQEVARAVYSVEAIRKIVVPILDLYYSERAVELACRLGKLHNAELVLIYIVEVPRLLTLDSPLPSNIEGRAKMALEGAKRIAERHAIKATTDIIRAREANEGIRKAVQAYHGDMVVLGMQLAKDRPPTLFARTVEALLRQPPCEVVIDSVPAA
ncbi:MAG: universal stress protein [Armatimonadota bacterium]|nr:universal stress protein [Armatimonadota bacterium]MCX7777714.1 universal stress protein [Armatimonadota bacterium]MDW8025871.1 universal stress protein [Armatimonadota bacterium]